MRHFVGEEPEGLRLSRVETAPALAGAGLLRGARRQNHHHLATFELGLGFHLGNRLDLFLDAVEELHAEFHMGHFAATETERQLDLVASLEEAAHSLHLHLIIMRVDVRTHLDLFDLDGLLLLARLGSLLLALIFHPAEIGDLAHGRLGVRCHLNQVKSGLFRKTQCIFRGENAAVVAFVIDELNLGNPDVAVCARAFYFLRRRFEWSANGRDLLELLNHWVSALCLAEAYVVSAGEVSIAYKVKRITSHLLIMPETVRLEEFIRVNKERKP